MTNHKETAQAPACDHLIPYRDCAVCLFAQQNYADPDLKPYEYFVEQLNPPPQRFGG